MSCIRTPLKIHLLAANAAHPPYLINIGSAEGIIEQDIIIIPDNALGKVSIVICQGRYPDIVGMHRGRRESAAAAWKRRDTRGPRRVRRRRQSVTVAIGGARDTVATTAGGPSTPLPGSRARGPARPRAAVDRTHRSGFDCRQDTLRPRELYAAGEGIPVATSSLSASSTAIRRWTCRRHRRRPVTYITRASRSPTWRGNPEPIGATTVVDARSRIGQQP